MSLRRSLADWPIVLPAWLMTLLAATLLAGGVIYPEVAAEAGLRRALADAPAGDSLLEVSHYATGASAGAVDELVRAELKRTYGENEAAIVRDWRSSETLAMALEDAHKHGGRAILGALDELSKHATLVSGVWPVPADEPEEFATGVPADPIQVAINDGLDRRFWIRSR